MKTSAPRLRLVTDSLSEPLTVDDAKDYARLDTSDDDRLVLATIKAARRRVEKETGLALLTQSWAAVFDQWPDAGEGGLSAPWWDGVREAPLSVLMSSGSVDIPKRPFQAVTAIRVRDAYGDFHTVDPTVYYTDVSGQRGRIIRKLGQVWPIIIMAPKAAIEVDFTAGFDAAPYSGVPDDLILAIKMLVKHWLDNREPVADGKIGRVPFHVQSIFDGYRETRLR